MTLSITTLCHWAGCPYAKCRILFVVILSVIMLSAVVLNVVWQSVVAPFSQFSKPIDSWLMLQFKNPIFGEKNYKILFTLFYICGP
jgi:hypothetical protein